VLWLEITNWPLIVQWLVKEPGRAGSLGEGQVETSSSSTATSEGVLGVMGHFLIADLQ
jgi:hypothetical protein